MKSGLQVSALYAAARSTSPGTRRSAVLRLIGSRSWPWPVRYLWSSFPPEVVVAEIKVDLLKVSGSLERSEHSSGVVESVVLEKALGRVLDNWPALNSRTRLRATGAGSPAMTSDLAAAWQKWNKCSRPSTQATRGESVIWRLFCWQQGAGREPPTLLDYASQT